jgi:hypothetical protein
MIFLLAAVEGDAIGRSLCDILFVLFVSVLILNLLIRLKKLRQLECLGTQDTS